MLRIRSKKNFVVEDISSEDDRADSDLKEEVYFQDESDTNL